MFRLLGISRAANPWPMCDDGEYLNFFTFGGLDSFNDVITNGDLAIDVMMAQYNKATPIQLPATYNGRSYTRFVPRIWSIFFRVNNVTATKTCRLPPYAKNSLDMGRSDVVLDNERELFLRYLITYNGEEPSLLL